MPPSCTDRLPACLTAWLSRSSLAFRTDRLTFTIPCMDSRIVLRRRALAGDCWTKGGENSPANTRTMTESQTRPGRQSDRQAGRRTERRTQTRRDREPFETHLHPRSATVSGVGLWRRQCRWLLRNPRQKTTYIILFLLSGPDTPVDNSTQVTSCHIISSQVNINSGSTQAQLILHSSSTHPHLTILPSLPPLLALLPSFSLVARSGRSTQPSQQSLSLCQTYVLPASALYQLATGSEV